MSTVEQEQLATRYCKGCDEPFVVVIPSRGPLRRTLCSVCESERRAKPKVLTAVTCVGCGEQFDARVYPTGLVRQKYHSPECRELHYKTKQFEAYARRTERKIPEPTVRLRLPHAVKIERMRKMMKAVDDAIAILATFMEDTTPQYPTGITVPLDVASRKEVVELGIWKEEAAQRVRSRWSAKGLAKLYSTRARSVETAVQMLYKNHIEK